LKLEALKNAPVVDPYTGPAILSGRASGVFFHEIFGHRIEGHRQKNEEEGQTFKKKIDEKILPEHISVVFDPTLKQLDNSDLVGYYKYDDEGIRARPVTVVDKGVFKTSSCPLAHRRIFEFERSWARPGGLHAVSRQSNLLVKTSSPLTNTALKKELIDECKKQGKPSGFCFRTSRRIYNDGPHDSERVQRPADGSLSHLRGRPSDELVRGVDLVGTPLVIFSNITDCGTKRNLHGRLRRGIRRRARVRFIAFDFRQTDRGAEKEKSQERPPILPRPDIESKSNERP